VSSKTNLTFSRTQNIAQTLRERNQMIFSTGEQLNDNPFLVIFSKKKERKLEILDFLFQVSIYLHPSDPAVKNN